MVGQDPAAVNVSSGSSVTDRGFVPRETSTPVVADTGVVTGAHLVPSETAVPPAWRQSFWGPVIAGSLAVLTLFVLSWYFMLGCHVGVAAGGVVALGWGAAVWLWVTACIAFYIGGMIAAASATARRPAWIAGFTVWSLTFPLGVLIYGLASPSGGVLSGLRLPHAFEIAALGNGTLIANATIVNYGFVWSAFITLILGVAFAVAGASTGYAACGARSISRT